MSPVIDWAAILRELHAGGLSYKAIARSVGCDVGTIYNVLAGDLRDLRHGDGVRLLALRSSRERLEEIA